MPDVSDPQLDFTFDPQQYPVSPGCFIIWDGNDRALLVGGTVNLRRRLAALFEQAAQPPPKTRIRGRVDDRLQRLVARARSIEVFLLPGNRYCPHLANSLIERYRPLFNLAIYMEPEGASFIHQTAEPFPRFTTRMIDGSPPGDCFGPFPSATRDLLIKSISEGFGIRTCHPMPRRACMSFQLKLCTAPCEGRISKEEYAWRVAQAARFLVTPGPGLIDTLETRRQAAADALEFEAAGRINAGIQALKPAIARLVEERDQRYDVDHEVHILYFAQGKVMVVYFQNGAPRSMDLRDAPHGLQGFLREQYYQNAPPELIIGADTPADFSTVSAELTHSNGYLVTITLPVSGPALDLLEIARVNHAYRVARLSSHI